jgi:RimJ/RimL family protein N-acetyltransferase
MAPEAGVVDVLLEPLAAGHAPRMARWMRDPAVVRGLGLRSEPDLDSTRAWIADAGADTTRHAFAILRAGEHVGNVVLDELDDHLATARLSIYVGEPRARGAGVAQRAIVLAAQHARDVLALYKLWLTVHAANAPAIAAYMRTGFVVEGTLRGEFLLDGERADALRMGLLLAPRVG